MKRAVLIRHGHAEKNVESRHGGKGASLTPEGAKESSALATKLVAAGISAPVVFASPRIQCVETADILASALGVGLIVDQRLEPYHMGVLDGLSDAEVRERYPELCQRMDVWRSGGCEIGSLNIPDAGDVGEFYARAVAFLNSEVLSESRDTLIVGTRSILIALASALLGRTPTPGGGYREIVWRNGALLAFDIGASHTLAINEALTTVNA
jgi:broad specificity phosphatase PhoE